MTYLTADQIGSKAGIDDVLEVVGFMEMFGLVFYQEGQSWQVADVPWYMIDSETAVLTMGRPVIELTSVAVTCFSGIIQEAVDLAKTEIVGRRFLQLTLPWPTMNAGQYRWTFEGTVGIAERVDMSAGDALKVGHTVIRAGVVMMIVEGGQVAQAGDVLLKPPALLNREAVTIARRMDSLSLDSDAVWDNDSNTIIDGFKKILRGYR